jgi:endoglucanase
MSIKKKHVETVVILAIFWLAAPLFAVIPPLHVDGNQIKDPQGNVVILRGIDLIDLGFLEEWHGGAIAMIDRITDKTDTQSSSPGWYPKIVRIMIAPPDSVDNWPHPFNPGNTDLYDLLRTVVDYCATKDMYCIIDWHYVANTYDHIASTSEFWTYMAPRFAGDDHVLFELFNEPINDLDGDWIFNSHDTDDWLSVRTDMQTWYNIVRTYAPDNIVLVGGPFYCQAIGPAASYPLTGSNIAIVSHIYPNHWNDSYWSSSYQNQITTCAAVYPVIMTEWGFSTSTASRFLTSVSCTASVTPPGSPAITGARRCSGRTGRCVSARARWVVLRRTCFTTRGMTTSQVMVLSTL